MSFASARRSAIHRCTMINTTGAQVDVVGDARVRGATKPGHGMTNVVYPVFCAPGGWQLTIKSATGPAPLLVNPDCSWSAAGLVGAGALAIEVIPSLRHKPTQLKCFTALPLLQAQVTPGRARSHTPEVSGGAFGFGMGFRDCGSGGGWVDGGLGRSKVLCLAGRFSP